MKRSLRIFSLLLITIIVFTNCATKNPMACCDFPASGTAGQSISFTSTCSTDANSYKWDFGDGTTSTVANVSHTYSTAGHYTVKLMAMNGNKMNEISKPITIN